MGYKFINNKDISNALQTLRPEAEWVLRGSTYDGLEWLDTNQTKPTAEELGL
jgi:hypothetical protein